MASLLFVCAGNICRSPMAQAIATRLRPEIDVASAGLSVMPGTPPTGTARDAMAELGIEIGDLRATAIEDELDPLPDLIYAMTTEQVAEIVARYPELEDRTELLSPDGVGIADPYGSDLAVYRVVRDEILRAVRARLVALTRD